MRRGLQASFVRRYRGEMALGRHVIIPWRTFHANVASLQIGDYVRFGDRVRLEGQAFRFGDHFFCGSDVTIGGHGARFEVGKFSSVGARVWFLLGRGNHRIQSLSNYPFGHLPHFDAPEWIRHFDYAAESSSYCAVGHDVWIGVGSIVLPNVTIGDGAVIGAGSVVHQDVPPYAIVGGNPAQVIAFRFKPSLIQEVRELKWWDWPIEKINRNAEFLTKNFSSRTTLQGIRCKT